MSAKVDVEVVQTKKTGFALLDKERLRSICALGGAVSNKNGTAHRFNSETARAAALRGIELRRKKRAAAAAEKQQQLFED